MLSPFVLIDHLSAEGATVYHSGLRTRVRLSRAALDLVLQFRYPAMESVVVEKQATQGDARACIATLVDRSILAEVGLLERLRARWMRQAPRRTQESDRAPAASAE